MGRPAGPVMAVSRDARLVGGAAEAASISGLLPAEAAAVVGGWLRDDVGECLLLVDAAGGGSGDVMVVGADPGSFGVSILCGRGAFPDNPASSCIFECTTDAALAVVADAVAVGATEAAAAAATAARTRASELAPLGAGLGDRLACGFIPGSLALVAGEVDGRRAERVSDGTDAEAPDSPAMAAAALCARRLALRAALSSA